VAIGTPGAGLMRLPRWLRRTPAPPPALDPDDPRLRVVARAFDPTAADSAVLAAAPELSLDRPALLRHALRLPLPAYEEASRLLGQDGYVLRLADGRGPDGRATDEAAEQAGQRDGQVLVYAVRSQQVTVLSVSQERSRAAGLAQRLGGQALGWEALQPREDPPSLRSRP